MRFYLNARKFNVFEKRDCVRSFSVKNERKMLSEIKKNCAQSLNRR